MIANRKLWFVSRILLLGHFNFIRSFKVKKKSVHWLIAIEGEGKDAKYRTACGEYDQTYNCSHISMVDCGRCLRSHAKANREPKYKRTNRKTLVGHVSGRLTVLERSGKARNSFEAMWLCQCTCGNKVRVSHSCIASKGKNKTQSCGCLHVESAKRNLKKAFEKRGLNGPEKL